MFKLSEPKKLLLRWCSWFFAGNIVLFWLLGLKYLHSVSWLGTEYITKHAEIAITGFLVISYLGQLALLAFAPFLLLALVILIYPRQRFILNLAVVIAAFFAVALVSDTVVYSLFHFHLNGIVLGLVFSSTNEQFFDFSFVESLMVVAIAFVLVIAEIGFAYWLWRALQQPQFLRGKGKWVLAVLSLFVYTSYTMLVYSSSKPFARFYLEATRMLPYYTEILGAMLPIKNGQVALERVFERNLVQPAQAYEPLNYPLKKLKFGKAKQKLNILIIGVDAWRFDMLNAVVAPNMTQFAQNALVFKQHFSGGDATGPGVFTLFYGLPATYWTSMQEQHRGPVLLDELQKHNYQMKILASAGLTLPPFNKTVFQAVKNLRLKVPGEGPYERDLEITKEFKQFMDTRDPKKPFFSFLFYDSSHSYCAVKNDINPFHPSVKNCDRLTLTNTTNPVPYFNRYRNAVHLVDIEVGKVLAYLKAHDLLDNTVVIITGDHGEEFNDNHLGYWGHTSNFTRFQTQTPLVVYWPGKKPANYSHLTMHFDLAPTLMEKVLGCKTPADQYSMGHSLFATDKTYPYLIIGSYIGFGIVEKDRITNIFPTGNYQVTQPNGQLLAAAKLRPEVMHSAYLEMRRFYK